MGAEFFKFLAARPGRYDCDKGKDSRVGLVLAWHAFMSDSCVLKRIGSQVIQGFTIY